MGILLRGQLTHTHPTTIRDQQSVHGPIFSHPKEPMELAALACLGWVITTWRLIDALKEKDRHHALHVSGLLNRIQAPEAAVAQALTQDEDYEPIVLPHTEDSYWDEVEKVDAA